MASWTKRDAFASFGATSANAQWSWSGRSADGSTVVLTFWKDRPNYQTNPISYDGDDFEDYDLRKLPGNSERKKNIRHAIYKLDSVVRVVIATAVDALAVRRRIAECYPQKNLFMKITEFDEVTGTFHAIAVAAPVLSSSTG